jgi:AcrR family transcriptional regulator
MQVLKSEIRQAILSSARDEFYKNGYTQTSMRTIASNVGITVGNIYRYFVSKEELFNVILEPVIKAIIEVAHVDEQLNIIKIDTKEEAKLIVDSILSMIKNFTKELFILVFNSEGSLYQFMKDDLIKIVEVKLMRIFNQTENSYFVKIISTSFVQALFVIFKDHVDDYDQIAELITELLIFYFRDFNSRV